MTHLTEEDLLDAYYGDTAQRCSDHLAVCPDCRRELTQLTEFLDELRAVPAPARTENYGRDVWAQLERKIPSDKAKWWTRPWFFAPASAALLSAAFVAGMLTMRTHETGHTQTPRAISTAADRHRVFLTVMADHLERSEILLAQLVHATPGELDVKDERARARDLLQENRLLRETASRSGDQAHAALLDDLERVFLDLANSPAQLSPQDVNQLRNRVEDQGLLFKVRITSTDARAKGPTL